jgi:formylmethanofuran dehydrogenase subunit B
MPTGTKTDPAAGVVCPFCGLFCDDLQVEVRAKDASVRVTAKGCELAKRRFEEAAADAGPRIDGKKADLEQACERAARILGEAGQPLIGGLATDLAGAKAAMSLADRTGAIVDHAGSEAAFRNMLVMQDKGWIATTLGEVMNRMDLLIVAGTDVVGRFPRFFERTVWNRKALAGPPPGGREVVFVGSGLDTSAGVAPDGRAPTVIPCDVARLGEVFGAVRALYHGRRLQASEIAGAPVDALARLAERIRASTYGVLAWAAADMQGPGRDLAVQALCDLVTDVNEKSRFSCLPLGGSDNGLGAAQVATWQAGFPLRITFARGHPEYDPYLNAWPRLLSAGEVDAVVWVSCFGPSELPFEPAVPTVVIGAPGMSFRREPAVYIPVGVPGLDHAGHVARTDAVASLPLAALRKTALPRAADVLAAIETRVLASREQGRC